MAGKGYRASNLAPSTTGPALTNLTVEQQAGAIRLFHCVFNFAGCQSTFAGKREWKRHVSIKHILQNYWRCPEGSCANLSPPSPSSPHIPTDPNGSIFNRKDLFIQHLKRMHAPNLEPLLLPQPTTGSGKKAATTKRAAAQKAAAWTAKILTLQETAMHTRCDLPVFMKCPVPQCTEVFCGVKAWDLRMEHVACHMILRETVVFGGIKDETLVEWASKEDVAIIKRAGDGQGWVLNAPDGMVHGDGDEKGED